MKRLAIGVVAILIAACGAPDATSAPATGPTPTSAPSATATHALSATIPLGGFPNIGVSEHGCFGQGDFVALKQGAEVTIRNETDTIIGTGKLSGGVVKPGNCVFTFTATVPEAAFYRMSVASLALPTLSLQDMTRANWKVTIPLG